MVGAQPVTDWRPAGRRPHEVTVTDTKAKTGSTSGLIHQNRSHEKRDRAKDPIPKDPTWRAPTLPIHTHLQLVARCLQIYTEVGPNG